MRTRKIIEEVNFTGTINGFHTYSVNPLTLELLLDIRDLLATLQDKGEIK